MEGICLKDFPIAWTTDPMDEVLKFSIQLNQRSHRVSHHIFHIFEVLEGSVIKALSSMYDHVYTIGPSQLLLDQIPETGSYSFPGYSLLKEEAECFEWLESKEPNSVIYVNFGSTTVMPLKDLGFIASWCSQEKVLNYPSVGGFLSHCGWGSTIESLSAGVPMICWPHRLDQVTNCRYICEEWGVGVKMQGSKVRRDEVTRLVQELMGEGGRGIRNKAVEWKEKARVAAGPYGSSSLNVDEIVKQIIMMVSLG
ncbi:putative UDP-glucuronosyl/UDP-glucosyltransferase, UDP-glycosyltransferase family [Helianthus annuus]|nr:putative UDP-glucuronosyl/UDP-glucosyltransferase, UDP-glycosyltransferase family [Helianthus annuus]